MSETIKVLGDDGLPRMCVGIPTFNRPERLHRAIQSVMGQSIPVRVIVADDGDTDEPERICREWSDNPNFTYLKSPAEKLWHNWRWVAERAIEAGATYFSWLQDDDLLAAHYARRVVRSFDRFPQGQVYLSSLKLSYDNMLSVGWVTNPGPRVPLDFLYLQPTTFPGKLLLPVAYFDTWAMSPAKAFRVGPAFRSMLDSIPDDCDMFTERLDLAAMGLHGDGIADPLHAGLWMIHGRNESQMTGDQCEVQLRSAYRWLDERMDGFPSWRDELLCWIACLGSPNTLKAMHDNIKDHADKSPYASQIAALFADILRGSGYSAEDLKPRAKGVANAHDGAA